MSLAASGIQYPERVETYLDALVQTSAGDLPAFVSLVLFGSAAKGGFSGDVSDVMPAGHPAAPRADRSGQPVSGGGVRYRGCRSDPPERLRLNARYHKGMALDERTLFTERPETRTGRYQCPKCRRTGEYSIRWVRRSKKDRPPPGADEADRAKFAKLRDYLLRLDDEVTCKTCGKKFEIPSQHSLMFVDQLAGLPNDEELEREISVASGEPERRLRASRRCPRGSRASQGAGSSGRAFPSDGEVQVASIGHVAVGMAAARICRPGRLPLRTLAVSVLLWSALSLLPDADVIGFSLGVRYESVGTPRRSSLACFCGPRRRGGGRRRRGTARAADSNRSDRDRCAREPSTAGHAHRRRTRMRAVLAVRLRVTSPPGTPSQWRRLAWHSSRRSAWRSPRQNSSSSARSSPGPGRPRASVRSGHGTTWP